MIKNVSIILVDVQLPENIGLTARAMFNFGVSNLILVNPKIDLPSEKAEAVAVDALDLVKNAKVYTELKEALKDFTYSFAFTARHRDMNKEFVNSQEVISEIHNNYIEEKIAIIFGGEASGLTNEHLSLASKCVTINTHSNFSSLNLSHAVSVFCYSLFLYSNSSNTNSYSKEVGIHSKNELIYFFEHLESELEARGFFEPQEKMPKMKQNLRNLFHRADLNEREIATLRGVVTALTSYDKSQKT
tara:strand:- start:500 stop:1234 length:735 start_codon:yes stop_codon:yes gene_type:complete